MLQSHLLTMKLFLMQQSREEEKTGEKGKSCFSCTPTSGNIFHRYSKHNYTKEKCTPKPKLTLANFLSMRNEVCFPSSMQPGNLHWLMWALCGMCLFVMQAFYPENVCKPQFWNLFMVTLNNTTCHFTSSWPHSWALHSCQLMNLYLLIMQSSQKETM